MPILCRALMRWPRFPFTICLMGLGLCLGLPGGQLPVANGESTPPAAPQDPAPADAPAPASGPINVDAASPPSLGTATVNSDDDEYYELLTLFTNTLDEIDRNYVEKVSRRELMEAAIEGMLRKLDPHSSYITPEHFDDLKTEVESEFGGIGVRLDAPAGMLRVISPLPDTPAFRAGILAGDAILAIDGASTEKMTTDEAVRRLKGPLGSQVSLVVQHVGSQETLTIIVPRVVVRVETVMGFRRRPDQAWDYWLDPQQKVGYVRIGTFGRYTGEELRDVLLRLQHDGMSALVLDLRFNPGGLLSAAVEVSDLFLAQGRIVSTAGRNVEARSWDAVSEGTFEDFRIAVLVNRYSASASEIVAAALQDHHRATVVGERTWGKASVQNIIELEGGRSAIKLTTAGYQRPSGKNIQKSADPHNDDWGVQPDPTFAVLVSKEELVSLRQQQAEREVVRSPQATPQSPTTQGFVDRQLEKAFDHLTSQIARR